MPDTALHTAIAIAKQQEDGPEVERLLREFSYRLAVEELTDLNRKLLQNAMAATTRALLNGEGES